MLPGDAMAVMSKLRDCRGWGNVAVFESPIPQDDIAGETGCSSYSDRDVDFGQTDFLDGRRVKTLYEAVEVPEFDDSLVVTHTAIDDHAAGALRVGCNRGGEVVADEGSPGHYDCGEEGH